jgi:hypothetical protein
MNRNLLFATVWLSTASAFAQPAQHSGLAAERQAAREQRRAELRTALQPNRQSDGQTTKAYDAPPAARHLSARELAEMRQQLRQQNAEVAHSQP